MKSKAKNSEIRKALLKNNVPTWRVALEMDIHPNVFADRLTCKEFTEEDRKRALAEIKKLAMEIHGRYIGD